jgi:hypothetical protein
MSMRDTGELAQVRKLFRAAQRQPPCCVHYVAPSFWAFRDGRERLRGLRGLVDKVSRRRCSHPSLWGGWGEV